MPYGKGARFVSRLTRNTLALILAGGRGDRLKDLTRWRAKPSVPFAGKFRIIDFPLSNCVNSGIFDVGILTQYRPHSLNAHIGNGKPWDLDRSQGGVELLQPYQGRRADLTVAVMHVPLEQTDRFGIMTTDESARVVEFTEKPKNRDKGTLASMGI